MKHLFLTSILSLLVISNFALAKSKGIENLQKATDGIYRGARPLNINEVQYLANLGVKSIVNLQGGDMNSTLWKYISWNEPGERPEIIAAQRSVALSFNMNFINTPLNSLDAVTVEEDQVINKILAYMHNKKNQPIYIHCEHGKDRTGLIVALYKVKYEGVSPEEAYTEWVQLGHNAKARIFTGKLDDYFAEKIKEFGR